MIGTTWGWWYAAGFVTPFILLALFVLLSAMFVPNSNGWYCRVCDFDDGNSKIPVVRWVRKKWHLWVIARTKTHKAAFHKLQQATGVKS